MNLDDLHARAAAALAGCNNPESFHAVALRAIMAESIVMSLERQRIDDMAARIPGDVMDAVKARRDLE